MDACDCVRSLKASKWSGVAPYLAAEMWVPALDYKSEPVTLTKILTAFRNREQEREQEWSYLREVAVLAV